MTLWGPPSTNAENDFPYAPYSKSEKLHKMADWTVLEKRKPTDAANTAFSGSATEQSAFSVVDRQNLALRKSAVRSARPILRKTNSQTIQHKKSNRFNEKPLKPRESSIKVSQNWKVTDELDFKRMFDLYYLPEEPVDMYDFLNFIGRKMMIV
jgi:translation initiation factor 3 subunit D